MRGMMKITGLLLLLAAFQVNAEPRDPYTHFFNQTFGDFTEELTMAREEGKKGVMLFFEMDECPFCHYMKTHVLNQPEVQAYFRDNFKLFSVDIEGDVEMTDFSGNTMSQKDFAFKINRVRATPVIAFYDLDGKQIFRYTGRTSGIEEFLLMGRYIADNHYNDLRFTRFKRENQ